jgi:hypothetical protein
MICNNDRTLDTCAHLTPRVPYTMRTHLPSTFPWLYLTGLRQSPPSHVTVYSTFGQVILRVSTLHHTKLGPHSFYNYIRVQAHYVSNHHVTVISPDHLHTHISCCIVTVISPRNLLCALAEHPEATFSPPTCV